MSRSPDFVKSARHSDRSIHKRNGVGHVLSGDEDGHNLKNAAVSPTKSPSAAYRIRRTIAKMQRFVINRPNLVQDLLSERVSASEFVETLERLPTNALHSFLLEWTNVFKAAAELADEHTRSSPPEIEGIPIPGSKQSRSTNALTESPQSSQKSRASKVPYGSSPPKQGNSGFSPPNSIIKAERERQKLHQRDSSHSPVSGSSQLSSWSQYRIPPSSHQSSDYAYSSPRSSGHFNHSSSSRDRLSNSHSSNQPLPPVKSNAAEAAAAIQPYLSKYVHGMNFSHPSNQRVEDGDGSTRSAQAAGRKHRGSLEEKDNPKDTRPNQWHLLRAITALAFASDQTHFSSPEASRHLISLMNGDSMVTPQSMMVIWSHFNTEQQQRWMRAMIQQFIRVNTSLNLFSKVTEEINYRKALAQILNSITELVSATSVSYYSVKPNDSTYSGEMKYVASTGPFDGHVFLPIGYGIAGRVAIERHMVHITNAKSDPRYASSVDGEIPLNTSLLSIPIFTNGHGKNAEFHILQICSAQFSPEDIMLLETLAVHLGTMLETVRSRGREISMRKKFQGLVEISNVLSSHLDLEQLMDVMRLKSKLLLEADRCTLFLVDSETRQLWTRLEEGPEITFPMNSGIAGYVTTTGETVNILDAYKDPRFRQDVDANTGYRTKSILCMPVRDNSGSIIAAIEMINKASGVFLDEDEELLSAFCSHAAVAIRNSRLHSKEIIERQKFQALAQIMEVVSNELELDPLISILRKKSKELLDSDKCTLFLLDKETQQLHTRLAEGMEVCIPLGHGIAGYVASTGETLNIPDAYADARFNKEIDLETGYKTNNILCMPVKSTGGNEILGSIQMVNKAGRAFGKTDEEVLRVFSSHAAITITKAKLYADVIDSKKKLESILGSIASFVITLNSSGLVVTSNRPIGELFGVDDDEIKTKPFWIWASSGGNTTLVRDYNRVMEANDAVNGRSYMLNAGSENEKIVNYSISRVQENDTKGPALDPRKSPSWDPKKRASVLLIVDDISDLSCMKKTIYDMESKIGQLRSQVTNVMEAPIQVVFRTIEKLSSGEMTMEVGRKELLRCVKLLARSDIFQPDVAKLLEGVSEDTKQMILLEYSHSLTHENIVDLDSWPDFEKRIKAESLQSLTWSFDALDYSDEYLISIIYDIFDYFNLVDLFHIPTEKLRSFVLNIRRNYRKNPFHNFYHAFTVLQVTFLILVSSEAAQYLRNIDILALVIAALCHDLDHPGVNNSFEINSHSELALIYNDISVQESHHCSVGFSILRNPDCNILVGLTQEEYKEFRKIVVVAILATDMAQHFEMTTKLKGAVATSQLSRENRDHRALLVSSILHSADLSNPIRPREISVKWAKKLRDEFHGQTLKEKELNIPVTPFMVIEDDFTLAKNEVGFIDFVIRPWWETMAVFLPGLQVCTDNLAENRAYWKSIVDSAQKQQNT